MTTDELLQRWSDGSITADELRELTAKLGKPEDQSALLDDWLLESSLPDRLPGAAVAGLQESAMNRRNERIAPVRANQWAGWFSWRPLTAAAAGIVFGMFCTSVVFGYVGPRLVEKVKAVFSEGFESGVTKTEPGLPPEVGHWGGDEAEVVKTTPEVKAHGGAKVLRFLSATYPGENSPRSQWGDVYRIVDVRGLAGAGSTVARVSASFARGMVEAEAQFSCSVDAMALEQNLSELPSRLDLMWLRQHASAAGLRKVALSSAREWKQVSVEVPITPETRFVVLHLAVVQEQPALKSGVVQFPSHFMDDVKVELITRP